MSKQECGRCVFFVSIGDTMPDKGECTWAAKVSLPICMEVPRDLPITRRDDGNKCATYFPGVTAHDMAPTSSVGIDTTNMPDSDFANLRIG